MGKEISNFIKSLVHCTTLPLSLGLLVAGVLFNVNCPPELRQNRPYFNIFQGEKLNKKAQDIRRKKADINHDGKINVGEFLKYNPGMSPECFISYWEIGDVGVNYERLLKEYVGSDRQIPKQDLIRLMSRRDTQNITIKDLSRLIDCKYNCDGKLSMEEVFQYRFGSTNVPADEINLRYTGEENEK